MLDEETKDEINTLTKEIMIKVAGWLAGIIPMSVYMGILLGALLKASEDEKVS